MTLSTLEAVLDTVRIAAQPHARWERLRGTASQWMGRYLTGEAIAGIEVYVDLVPPQFQPHLPSRGSIVIWTKRRRLVP